MIRGGTAHAIAGRMHRSPAHLVFAVAAVAVLLPACGGGSLVTERPRSAVTNHQVTVMWARDVERTAQTGDWILTRSYSLNGDLIVAGTRGESVSHASIYDARTKTVIEAVRPDIREVPVEHLLDRNRLAIVVRPVGLTDAERIASVDRARSKVGTAFDLAGLFGVGTEERFYCSELVYWASGMEARAGKPFVVTPAGLMEYGEVVYYSGKRDKPETIEAARAQEQLLSSR